MVGGRTFPAVEVDLGTSLWGQCPRGISTVVYGDSLVWSSRLAFTSSGLALSRRVAQAGTDTTEACAARRLAPQPYLCAHQLLCPRFRLPLLCCGGLLQEASWDPLQPWLLPGASAACSASVLALFPWEAQTQPCSHAGPDLNPPFVPGCLRFPGEKTPTCGSLGE